MGSPVQYCLQSLACLGAKGHSAALVMALSHQKLSEKANWCS